MPPHLLRCQGLAVADYSFVLGRLEAGAPSTFAQIGYCIKLQVTGRFVFAVCLGLLWLSFFVSAKNSKHNAVSP